MIASLVLLSFSNTASAESPYIQPLSLADFSEWSLTDKMGNVESIELEGIIEVPMYTDINGNPKLQVYVQSAATEEGDMGDLFELRPDSRSITVTEAFATANELEIKTANKRLIPVPDDFKVGGEVKYVVIPSLTIGKMVLNNVTALVEKGNHSNIIPSSDLSIGLASLPTSYAIMNSLGVVKFGDDAAAMASEIGATAVPYKSETVLVGTSGSWAPFGQSKVIMPSHSLVIDATFGDQTVPTELDFTGRNSLDKYVATSSEISSFKYDLRSDWLGIKVGDVDMGNAFVSRPVERPLSDAVVPVATLGQQVLSQFDIVVDQSNATIAFAKHEGLAGFSSIYEMELEKAQAALAPEESEETDGDSDAETEEASLNVGGINGLISVLKSGKEYTAALEQYNLLIADDEEKTDCALWLDYGDVQKYLGNTEEARKAYVESARLYHSWWDIDLNTRMDINKAQADMKDEDIEAAKALSKDADINSVEGGWFLSQPERCYVADGKVAGVDLALGNHKSVEENYRSNLDLDDGLARIFGNSALAQGQTEIAHEAYRQAIQLEDSQKDRALNRFGLALVYADQGKWEQANDLFSEALELKDCALMSAIWLDNAIAQSDATSATNALRTWADAHPTHSGVRIALLRHLTNERDALAAQVAEATSEVEEGTENTEAPVELENTEQTDLNAQLEKANQDLAAAIEKASQWMGNFDAWYGTQPVKKDLHTLWFLIYTGDLDGAQSLLDQHQADLQDHPGFNFAAANLYARQGKTEEAQQALSKAALLGAQHPGFVLTK
jgi:tetratricopeptide (TPR) repeat protein